MHRFRASGLGDQLTQRRVLAPQECLSLPSLPADQHYELDLADQQIVVVRSHKPDLLASSYPSQRRLERFSSLAGH